MSSTESRLPAGVARAASTREFLRRTLWPAAIAATISVAAFVFYPLSAADVPATVILHSGKLITLNAGNDIAQAIAIRDGLILEVGSNADVLELKDEHTQVVDLKGRTVIPGLVESHSHPTGYGMHIYQPDVSKARSLAEIVALIGDKVKQSKPGVWITNSRIWNETKLVEKRNPTRADLDAVSPNNPVYLSRGHLGVANSAALKAVGIDRNTPDPPGGTIEKDEKGEPTGRLYERRPGRVPQGAATGHAATS